MADPVTGVAKAVEAVVKSKQGKWIRRLNALVTNLVTLRETYSDDHDLVKAAEDALIRHFDALHD